MKITAIITILILLMVSLASSVEYTETTEKTCINNSCEVKVYSYEKRAYENNNWLTGDELITLNTTNDLLNLYYNNDLLLVLQLGIYNGTYYPLSNYSTETGANYNIPLINTSEGMRFHINLTDLPANHNIEQITIDYYSGVSQEYIEYNYPKWTVDDKVTIDFSDVFKDHYYITHSNVTEQIRVHNFSTNQTTIYIDPEVLLDENNVDKDTFIEANDPTANNSDSNQMRVQSESSPASSDEQMAVMQWDITPANIPVGATNVNAILNLTESGSSNAVNIAIWNVSNTTWSEDKLNFNNFFCGVTNTGRIDVGNLIQCDEIIGTGTSLGTSNIGNSYNISDGVGVGTTTLTFVIESTDNNDLEIRFKSTGESMAQRRPFLLISWDEGNASEEINITPITPEGGVINITETSAVISWTTATASNSTINYGTSPTNLNLIQENSDLVTTHNIELTGLTSNTQYFFNITSAFNPSQTIGTFNFTTTSFNITIQVTVEDVQASIDTSTTTQTNSSIQYGVVQGNPTFVNNDFGFKFNRVQNLTSLADQTTYYVNQTLCTVISECEMVEYNFTTLQTPALDLQEEDSLDLSSCLDRVNDFVVDPDTNFIYAMGSDANSPFVTEKIAVINGATPSNLVLDNCFNVGDVGAPRSISFINSLTVGFSGFLMVGGTTRGIEVHVVNGDTLSVNATINTPMPQGALTNNLRDDLTLSVDSDNLREYNLLTQSLTVTINNLDFNDPVGISNPVQGTHHLIVYKNAGQIFTSFTNEVTATLSDSVGGVAGSTSDAVEYNGLDKIVANGFTTYIYQYNPTTENITKITTVPQTAINQVKTGSAWISDTEILYLEQNTINGTQRIRSGTASSTLTDLIFTLTETSSAGGTLQYEFPTLYLSFNSASSVLIKTYTVIPATAQAGTNVKPVITNIIASPPQVGTGEATTIFYQVDNPETNTLNEDILTRLTCDYIEVQAEIETFDDDFDFGSKCGKTIIGTRKGNAFNDGLDLTACGLNEVILTNNPQQGNIIMSFDIFSDTTGTAVIELIQDDGSLINQLTIQNNNDLMNIQGDGITLFENLSTKLSGQAIPIRLFVQMNPSTVNPNLLNRIGYATNYFTLNANINKTYCDSQEFCYIADNMLTSATNLNAYRGLQFISASGSMSIDNFRIIGTGAYPTYTSTTDLTQNPQCSYTKFGERTARIYASDVVYEHNYLGYKDATVQVFQNATIPVPPIQNGTLGSAIIDVLGVFIGADQITLLIFSLMLMIGTFIGALRYGFGVLAGLFTVALEATLFFILNMITFNIFLIVLLLASGFIAVMMRQVFMGEGTG